MAEPNFANRTLFHGDNLGFLRKLDTGTVHLIATDPPFKKGRDFHATPDSLAAGASFQDRWSWARDVHQDWVDKLADDYPHVLHVIEGSRKSYGDDMGAFLCFMGVRLLEMRRVLRDEGTIYLHCDHTASHYLKELMDAIFQRRNFRNEIVWQRTITRKGNLTRGLAEDTDTILRYSKGRQFTWNSEAVTTPYDLDDLDEKTRAKYSQKDEDGRLYQLTAITSPTQEPRSPRTYEVMGVTRTWRWTKERMEREIAEGRIVQTKPGNVPRQIRYLDEQKGKTLNNVWTDIPAINSQARERTGYGTQKPIALYERIIRASSNPGDIVLDPFAGCATTCVAAERLGRRWVGMDIWDRAHETVLQRLQDEGLASPDGGNGERLLTFGQIHYATEPPERTDDGEEAVPYLRLKVQRAPEPWERLSRARIFEYLAEAQAGNGGVICGGCGIVLASRYMELDHIRPRSDGGANDITNRLLLCGPCNGLKRDDLTMRGLRKELWKRSWMVDEARAKLARNAAEECAERVRDELSG